MLDSKYIKISFEKDYKSNFNLLSKNIENSKILVIGGAGNNRFQLYKGKLNF